MSGFTVQQMVSGRAAGTGPVPTQTFRGTDIAGTVIPKVGAAQATPATGAGQFATVHPQQIVIIVLVLIAAGYLIHHLSFEESARAGVSG
ncbi:MAG: hypothetical protein KGL95_15695 [Patescibacteria group bacterium]|nr:hypothetical protein [Patescibacteria group bacterium]